MDLSKMADEEATRKRLEDEGVLSPLEIADWIAADREMASQQPKAEEQPQPEPAGDLVGDDDDPLADALQHIMDERERRPFRVRLDTQGACKHETQWCVTNPEGAMLPRTWNDRDEAEWMAEMMNLAWDQAQLRTAAGAASSAARDEQEDLQLIQERDEAEEKGTELAEAVGEFFGVDVGEHSSANDPRDVALEILAGGYKSEVYDRAKATARDGGSFEEWWREHGPHMDDLKGARDASSYAFVWDVTNRYAEKAWSARDAEIAELRLQVKAGKRGPEFYAYVPGAISDTRLEGMIDETRWWKVPGDEVYEVVRELRATRAQIAELRRERDEARSELGRRLANPQVGTCAKCGAAIWNNQERMTSESGVTQHLMCIYIARYEAAEAANATLREKTVRECAEKVAEHRAHNDCDVEYAKGYDQAVEWIYDAVLALLNPKKGTTEPV